MFLCQLLKTSWNIFIRYCGMQQVIWCLQRPDLICGEQIGSVFLLPVAARRLINWLIEVSENKHRGKQHKSNAPNTWPEVNLRVTKTRDIITHISCYSRIVLSYIHIWHSYAYTYKSMSRSIMRRRYQPRSGGKLIKLSVRARREKKRATMFSDMKRDSDGI